MAVRKRERHHELRGILRDIARWAVASSIGAAGCGDCGAGHTQLDLDTAAAGKPGDGSAGNTMTQTMNEPRAGNQGSGGMSIGPTIGVPNEPRLPIGGSGGTPAVAPEWMPLDCTDRTVVPRVLANVAFKDPFDYVALFRSTPDHTEFGMDGGVAVVASSIEVDSSGNPCATAADQPACLELRNLGSLPSEACVERMQCAAFLLMTRGDSVARVDDRNALLTMLGTIDSAYEAALLAMFDGYVLTCPSFGGVPDATLAGTEFRSVGGGFELRTDTQPNCRSPEQEFVHVTADGALSSSITTQLGTAISCWTEGRRPEGLHAARRGVRSSALGAYFAEVARLEAASVPAFERMAAELCALGAPRALVVDALRAALDEVRHARIMGELARRHGAEPQPVEVAAWRERTALDIALENAVEGCVRETYAALLAHHQAQAASDPEVRAAKAQIAEDETRHAELSWRVARWLEPRLSQDEQHAVAAARTAALAQLFGELDAGFSQADARAIGWPAPEVAAHMLTRLGAALAIA